jgi:hypothetical protein
VVRRDLVGRASGSGTVSDGTGGKKRFDQTTTVVVVRRSERSKFRIKERKKKQQWSINEK